MLREWRGAALAMLLLTVLCSLRADAALRPMPAEREAALTALTHAQAAERERTLHLLGEWKDPETLAFLFQHRTPILAGAPRLESLYAYVIKAFDTPAGIEKLVELSDDGRNAVRHYALETLASYASTKELAGILAQLNGSAIDRRDGLDLIGPYVQRPAVIQRLIRILKDQDYTVRDRAARVLSRQTEDPAAIPALVELLADNQEYIRRGVTSALAEWKDAPRVFAATVAWMKRQPLLEDPAFPLIKFSRLPEAEAACLLLMRDGSPSVRRGAIVALNEYPDLPARTSRLVPALLRVIEHDTDAFTKTDAAGLLGKLGDPSTAPTLLKALQRKEGDGGVRQELAKALWAVQGATAITALLDLLKDPDPRRRSAILVAFETCQDPRVLKTLRTMSKEDPDDMVRLGAQTMMAMAGDPETSSHLMDTLKDPNPMVRMGALVQLRFLNDPRTTSIFLKATEDPDPHVRAVATGGLNESPDPVSLRGILKGLKDPHEDVRQQAEWGVLPSYMDKKSGTLPYLLEGLKDGDARVRLAVVGLLTRQWDPHIVPALKPLVNDPDPEVRAAALKALDALGDIKVFKPRSR